MKRIYFILLSFLVFSCEDNINVDLENAPPRLVIDASINWLKNTPGNEQEIKLTLSTPYFSSEILPATNATVEIIDSNNNTFTFIEEGQSGIYKNTTFIPVLNQTYTLHIVYNEEIYTATETLQPVVPIDFIEQNNNGGFSGEDIELKAYYTDPETENQYYFFEFISPISVIPSLEVYSDEFTNGNQIFGYYSNEDIETGDQITIKIHGISRQFYEFMFLLLQQNSEEGGGPFETQPATLRGNCVNQTNPNHFPFGYFRLSEVDQVDYTVE
ncbi:MAG TPA: DUF4249 domain-containing protein [Flavobacteriaceae bacterium]|nr:DUF4249 domain-containing protein [Flavobacteriaceae bacterium]